MEITQFIESSHTTIYWKQLEI